MIRRRGLTLLEVLIAAALLAVLAAAAAPLLRELAAGPGRLRAAAAVERLAALSPEAVAAALAGDPPDLAPQRLEVVTASSAGLDLVEPVIHPGLRQEPPLAGQWVECRLLAADGRILARCPRLVRLPAEAAGEAAVPEESTEPAPQPDQSQPPRERGTPPTVLP